MNHFYVYQLRVEDSILPFYVGKGFGQRAFVHGTSSDDGNNHHKKNTIKKAEREGKKVLVEYIKTDLIEDDAFMWEVFWIAEYGRKDLGFGPLTNKTDGGEGASGTVVSEETREKQAAAKRGKTRAKHSEETKRKMSQAALGKPKSDEMRRKMREVNLGKKQDEEVKRLKSLKRWMYNPISGESLMVDPDQIQIYLGFGWLYGRKKK